MATGSGRKEVKVSGGGGEDDDYESDPEEEKRLLGMRRRKAASDEEEERGGEEGKRREGGVESDISDGEGGAEDYYDVDEDDDVEEEEEEEELEYEDEEEREGDGSQGLGVKEKEVVEGDNVGVEGKKDNEPFTVPTAGAFYMHDDRFVDNLRAAAAGRGLRGRNRRMNGGRRLWESKDEQKWGHDKFEEMSVQDGHYVQGRRSSRGHYRGHGGRNRGMESRYGRRGRPRPFGDGDNQNHVPKVVRGRGPRKYEFIRNTVQSAPMQSRQPWKYVEKTSHGKASKVATSAPNTESNEVAPARKLSSLSSASPPFYPSGSSNKDATSNQKRDVQAASTSRNSRTPAVEENFSMQKGSAMMHGKNTADDVGLDGLYIDDSATTGIAKPMSSIQTPLSGSSLALQSSQSRAQGMGRLSSGEVSYLSGPQNHVNRGSPAQRTVQNRIQSSFKASSQQSRPLSSGGSRTSSLPNAALSVNSYEAQDVETSSELRKAKTALDIKEKSIVQGSGRGSFQYGGGQVVGASASMGVSHGDQNFPATPTFLPVMQFGGQHHGGIGVPAVGMAFPGYVAQSQHGLGNSEMTWLPVLTGAAGALGASFGSPYIAVDGAYHAHPSGQASVTSSSRESNSDNTINGWKLSQRPESANNDVGQRQKPRRYSEMDFKQPSTST